MSLNPNLMIERIDPALTVLLTALDDADIDALSALAPTESPVMPLLAGADPTLAQALTDYVANHAPPGTSINKICENAARGLFGLAAMSEADERVWLESQQT